MPGDAVIAASSHSMYGDAEWVEWVPLHTFASLNAYPRFFATHLVPLPQQPVHIVTREDEPVEGEATAAENAVLGRANSPGPEDI